ncbi:hypothetical protein BQ8794_160052 [Mesorhizobium prunaredense]|uniref:Uncharacterized protein n=1 Tax=Mesorhizobium prunaredense TaxID=1631249 RepID=A0A1R3V5D3_9HYPH|nr:hypothetical protein BQ8794_160052 [Mesorhizobium prunaredense]
MLEIRQKASLATIFDFLLNALGEFVCRVAWPFAEPGSFGLAQCVNKKNRPVRVPAQMKSQIYRFALPP